MKFTIEDLRNGKCAVKNDGTTEELREVLIRAFPDDGSGLGGAFRYYVKSSWSSFKWDCSDYTDLPYQSVKDFLTEPDRKVPNLDIEDKVLEMWEYYQKHKKQEVNGDPNKRIRVKNSSLIVNGSVVQYQAEFNAEIRNLMCSFGGKNLHLFLDACMASYFNKDKHVDISKWYGDFDDD